MNIQKNIDFILRISYNKIAKCPVSDFINIEAVYLLDSDADSLAFATRIVNIPDSGKATELYARAYYVFEKDGELIVIYDDIVSESYTDAIA